MSTIQGNFLSPSVQGEVKRFLADPDRGRVNSQLATTSTPEVQRSTVSGATVINNRSSYVELERHMQDDSSAKGRLVDVVLSDMSAPFEQTTGFWKRSLSDPYFRMMNTSGIPFKDHAGSMVRQTLLFRPCRQCTDECYRIYVQLRCNLHAKLSRLTDTSFANSTKA